MDQPNLQSHSPCNSQSSHASPTAASCIARATVSATASTSISNLISAATNGTGVVPLGAEASAASLQITATHAPLADSLAAPPSLSTECAHDHTSSQSSLKRNKTTEGFKDTLASVAAGLSQATVGHPFNTVLVRMQTDARFTNPITTARTIVRDEGLRGMYKGYSSMVFGLQLINYILMPSYQFARRTLDPNFKYIGAEHDSDTLRWDHVFMSGAFGGLVGAPLVTSIERFKTRAQFLNMKHPGHTETLQSAMKTLLREQGARRAFFTGFTPCLLRETLGNGFWFLGYEAVRHFAAQYYGTQDIPLHALALSGATAGFCFWTSSTWLDTIKTTIMARDLHGKDANMYRVARTLMKERNGGFMTLYKGYSASILRSLPTAASIVVSYSLVRRWLD